MKPEHGTLSRYSYGCRCRACRQANASYGRERRHRLKKTACRVCELRGLPRPLEASIGPRLRVVGEIVLCDRHANPDVVETGWWQPGARLETRR